MADNKLSVASLFGGIGSDEQLRAATQARDFAMGQQLAGVAPERVGLLYAPQAVTAAGRAGRLFAGQDTRTKEEIEGAKNREIFQRISTEAERLYPDNRTKQLLYVANKLSAEGKVVEAQKARALAQESAKTQADITKTEAEAAKNVALEAKAKAEAKTQVDLRSKYSAEAMRAAAQSAEANAKALKAEAETTTEGDKRKKLLAEANKAEADAKRLNALADKARAEAGIVGLGNVDPEKFTTTSVEAFQESVKAGNPDYDLLEVRPEVDMTTYQKELAAAFPDDPAKRSKLFQKYITEKSQRGGLDVQLDRTEQEWVFNHNATGITEYRKRSGQAQQVAQSVDAMLPTVEEAITGAGGDLLQFVQSVSEKLGITADFGDLTGTQLIKQFLSQEVLGAAAGLSGALSDKDIKFLEDTVGGLGNTPEAIRVALVALKNRKLIARQTADNAQAKFAEMGDKNTLKLSDALNFDEIEEQTRTELGLPNPRLFGGVWILPDGTVDPTRAADPNLIGSDAYNRATPEAKMALAAYYRNQGQVQ